MRRAVLNLAVSGILIFAMAGCGESDNLFGYPDDYKIEKTILDNGKVQLTYSDGKIEIRSEQGTVIKYPDGRPDEEYPNFIQVSQVQSSGQPEAPPTTFWSEDHASDLLEIIRKQVDLDSYNKYLAFERNNPLDVFRNINRRSQTINYLVSP